MKARGIEGLSPEAPLRGNAVSILRTRLDEMRSFVERALEPGAMDAQHNMRIAAKRLRYVLEITGFCFGMEAEAARDAARALQSVLGDIRDCEAMLSRAQGIDSLTPLLHARRELLLRRFSELWEEQAREGVWTDLERALH
jgi:CHAD domain-containing protein